MATIRPSFTLTANSSEATTEKGPASIALSLSASPLNGTSTVTDVHTQVYTTAAGPAHETVYSHTFEHLKSR